jgi:hypothetical protein
VGGSSSLSGPGLGALDRGGGAGTRNLNARCRRFESGDWETLLAERHERKDELAEEREDREAPREVGSLSMRSRRSAGSAVVYDLDVRVSLAVHLEFYGRVNRHPPQRGRSRLYVSCIVQRHHLFLPR